MEEVTDQIAALMSDGIESCAFGTETPIQTAECFASTGIVGRDTGITAESVLDCTTENIAPNVGMENIYADVVIDNISTDFPNPNIPRSAADDTDHTVDGVDDVLRVEVSHTEPLKARDLTQEVLTPLLDGVGSNQTVASSAVRGMASDDAVTPKVSKPNTGK